jgi:hypothetical protein
VIGYGFTSGNVENEKYDSIYMRETTRLTEASEKAMVYNMII